MKNNKIISCVVTGVITVCLLTSCQKTPETPIVVSKNDGKLEEVLQADPAPELNLRKGDFWDEEFDSIDNTTHIVINAEVETPDVKTIPVVNCAPYYFTEDEASRAIKLLFGEEPLYDNSVDDKSNIEELLFREKMNLQSLKETGEYPIREGENRPVVPNLEEEIAFVEKQIKDLEDSYAKATKDASKMESFEFKSISEEAQVINVRDDKTKRHQMYVFNDKNANDAAMLYEYVEKNYLKKQLLSQEEDIGIQISRAEAEHLAINTIKEIGAVDCIIISTSSAQIDGKPCYMFELARSINNVSCREFESYSHNVALGVDGQEYRAPWNQEVIQVVVSEDGIIEFNWEFPSIIYETVNENVAIKPYEEIQAIAKNQLERLLSADDFALNKQEKTIYINKVILNYMRVAKKDEIDRYYYLPVWDFVGEIVKENTEAEIDKMPTSNISFLTINAIDGSIINRELGY